MHTSQTKLEPDTLAKLHLFKWYGSAGISNANTILLIMPVWN